MKKITILVCLLTLGFVSAQNGVNDSIPVSGQ